MKAIRMSQKGLEASRAQRAIFSEFLIPVEVGGRIRLRTEDIQAGARVLEGFWDRKGVGPWNAGTDIVSARLDHPVLSIEQLHEAIIARRAVPAEEIDQGMAEMLEANLLISSDEEDELMRED